MSELLRVTDYVILEDGTIIFAADDTLYQFDVSAFHNFDNFEFPGDPNTPVVSSWESGKFPRETSFKRIVRMRISFEVDAGMVSTEFVITITNENGSSKTINFSTSDSGIWKQVNLVGRTFQWIFTHSDNKGFKISQVELEIQQDRDT